MTTTNQAIELGDAGTIAAGIFGWVDDVPTAVWQTAIAATAGLLLLSLIFGKRVFRRAGERRAKRVSAGQRGDNNNDNTDDNSPEALAEAAKARRDSQLLIATLVPAALFWLAVLVGSGRGLTAFGRDTLDWHNGWDWIVPATLDGVAVTFAGLAFRALWKGRNPDRARRIVWSATATSASLNFLHELLKDHGNGLGAVYLGILSVLGMAILDEFLGQFEEGAGYIKREKPRFGLRWFTLPYATLCAWLAWTNYPPELETEQGPDGVERTKPVTIRMAIDHLEVVRVAKAEQRNERDARRSTLPAWTRVAPWIRARKLQAMLDRSNRSIAAERHTTEQRLRAEQEQALRLLRNELTGALQRSETEHQTERTELLRQLNQAQSRAEQAEKDRATVSEQAHDLEVRLSGTSEQATGASQLVQHERQRAEQAERQSAEAAAAAQKAIAEARQLVESERRSAEQRERELRSEMNALRKQTEQTVETLRSNAEQESSKLLRQLEEERSGAAEQINALRSELAEHSGNVTQLRSNASSRSNRSNRTGAERSGATKRSTGAAKYETDLGVMFLEHPEHEFAWTTREVNKVTGAGFSSKAPNLVAAAQEHYRSCSAERHDEHCLAASFAPEQAEQPA